MRIEEIKDILECDVLTDDHDLSIEVNKVLASDGMSEILAFHSPGALMVTGLTNIQSVRTADFADARAIVYIRGKRPNEKTIELARQKSITVMATNHGMFDVCGMLWSQGMKGVL
jgi:predicted transcriptional regulator